MKCAILTITVLILGASVTRAQDVEYFDQNHVIVDGMIMSIDYIEYQFKPQPAVLRWDVSPDDTETESADCQNNVLSQSGFDLLNTEVIIGDHDPREPVIDRLLNGEGQRDPALKKAYDSVVQIRRPVGPGQVDSSSGVLVVSNDTVVTAAHQIFADYPDNTVLAANLNETLVYVTHDLKRYFTRYRVVGVIPYSAPHKSHRSRDLVVLKIEEVQGVDPSPVLATRPEEFSGSIPRVKHVAFHGDRYSGLKKLVQLCESRSFVSGSPFPEERAVVPTTCSAEKGASGGGLFPEKKIGDNYPLVAIQRGFYNLGASKGDFDLDRRFSYSAIIDDHAADYIVDAASRSAGSAELMKAGFWFIKAKKKTSQFVYNQLGLERLNAFKGLTVVPPSLPREIGISRYSDRSFHLA